MWPIRTWKRRIAGKPDIGGGLQCALGIRSAARASGVARSRNRSTSRHPRKSVEPDAAHIPELLRGSSRQLAHVFDGSLLVALRRQGETTRNGDAALLRGTGCSVASRIKREIASPNVILCRSARPCAASRASSDKFNVVRIFSPPLISNPRRENHRNPKSESSHHLAMPRIARVQPADRRRR